MNERIPCIWLPTGPASKELAVSQTTLKRYADRDNILHEGVHFRFGAYRNSPRVWNVTLCQQALSYRGRGRKE